ncbi:BrnT family toxin [Polynucleobacter sp. UB-Raua-W9]|uniref:BrnT family toxin n=1 Tax=Polynucleobacter sp. UB-Raua-W9 TaxID=1819736 RepID=UPI00203C234F|nr:BrnT family toxin [Polynucleobacter sp. UB-Raua-W9]
MIEFDKAKREITLFARGLDMARANEVFDAPHMNQIDCRKDYGEARITTFGYLDDQPVFLAWTYRGRVRRIISIRRANEREVKKYERRMG